MAYELEDLYFRPKRVDLMQLHDHELRSIQDIKRIYERGLYKEKSMLLDHIAYLQELIRKCAGIASTEQAEGYNNVELKRSTSDIVLLHKRLTELAAMAAS